MKALNVLLIEDDAIEVMKLNRVVATLQLKHQITEANNGEQAIKLLKEASQLPDIILLDLNMPKMSGLEFLSLLKADKNLQHIPTIILTTSSNHKDLLECYRVGISGYVLKPLKYEDYVSKIETVMMYWSTNELIKK